MSIKKLANKMRGKAKKLSLPYVSIFLVFSLLFAMTSAWFTFNDAADIKSKDFTLESVSGLRVNDGEDLSNRIVIDDLVLSEASSVDGRNMYFPTTESFTSKTDEMVFREGNVGDINYNYCHRDFTIKGDSGVTYIYVKSYKVTVDRNQDGNIVTEVFDGSTKIGYQDGVPVSQEQHAECPIRIAFIKDSSEKPVVIDPSALIDGYAKQYNAVSDITELGNAFTSLTDAGSFSSYYYATGQPIFALTDSTPVNASIVVWLEGTSEQCSQYAGQKISIDIELESNWTDTEFVYFVDDTLPDNDGGNSHWVSNDDCFVVMSYTDADNSRKSVVMKRMATSGENMYKWYAPIPKSVDTNISFYRYSNASEIIFNAWHTKYGVNKELSPGAKIWAAEMGNLQESRNINGNNETVYTARRGNGYSTVSESDPERQKKRLSPCIGYWGTSGGPSIGGGQTGGEQSGGIQTEGTVKINSINLRGVKSWVFNNINDENIGYSLYLVMSDGTAYKMENKGDYFAVENQEFNLKTYIKGFELRRESDSQALKYYGQEYIISNSGMTFHMQNDDTIIRTS